MGSSGRHLCGPGALAGQNSRSLEERGVELVLEDFGVEHLVVVHLEAGVHGLGAAESPPGLPPTTSTSVSAGSESVK